MEYQSSYNGGSSSSHTNNLQPMLSLSSQRSLASFPSLNNNSQSHDPHHHCLTTLKGHNSYISSLTLSDKILFTGSSDREIKSWNPISYDSELDLENKNRGSISSTINTVLAGKGAVKSLVFQSDKLFSAHQDHKIRVWKINSVNDEPEHQKYTRIATLPTLGDRALKMLIPKNHVQIRRHKKRTWVHHVDTVSALALSKDGGTLLYSVSWDKTIKIWRTSDFSCLESVNNAHDDAINAIVVSYDGRVYTGSADNTIKVWEKCYGEKKHSLIDTLEKHNSGINALALSSDESLLYSGACDRSILVWEKGENERKMVVVGALKGHKKSILCLYVVSDLVCSGSADKTIRIWRGLGREYSCLVVLEGHMGPIKCLTGVVDHSNSSESEASFLVYSGSLDCDIRVWQIFVPVV
ncbi:hypothetical protein Lal_00015244 [Lupinus albus]|uniref:Putative [Myosin heavy-chain] kinase transcription factor WD40-like family n=1 Tax=Lupinus albus TaxID=3870 RepID=A0A6A5M8M3_LUPAL|nr:putative [Myosin heavy-chain] kinase transcription factor WD40-like family [Lupinus albus]KAF1870944.1 hypothetical protein Lal_00015244 [Lupinus albus]